MREPDDHRNTARRVGDDIAEQERKRREARNAAATVLSCLTVCVLLVCVTVMVTAWIIWG